MSIKDEQARRLWQKFKKRPAHHLDETCPEENMLAAYIDGVISAPESDRIESHLVCCSHCMSSVLDLKLSSEDVGDHPPPELIRQLKRLEPEKQMQANFTRPRAGSWRETLFMRLRYGMGWAVAAAFIIIASAGGYKLGQETIMLKVSLEKRLAVEAPLPLERPIASPFTEEVL